MKTIVDGIILGCTEIPLLLHAELDAPDLLNPAALLAEAAVRQALGDQATIEPARALCLLDRWRFWGG